MVTCCTGKLLEWFAQGTLRKLPGNVEPGFLPSPESSLLNDEPLGESEIKKTSILSQAVVQSSKNERLAFVYFEVSFKPTFIRGDWKHGKYVSIDTQACGGGNKYHQGH